MSQEEEYQVRIVNNTVVNILWLYEHYTLKSCISRAMIQLWEIDPHLVGDMHTTHILPFIASFLYIFLDCS